MEKNEKKLFDMFNTSGKQAWLETVTKDLRGNDFEKSLVWQTDDGFDLQPMYFAEDIKDIEHDGFTPGAAPFVRGTSLLENKKKFWTISQFISTPDVKQANRDIVTALSRGQTGAHMIVDIDTSNSKADASDSKADVPDSKKGASNSTESGQSGIRIGNEEDFKKLLDEVDTGNCELTFDAGNATPVLLAMFRNILVNRGVKNDAVNAVFSFDPLTSLALDGRLPWSKRDMFNLCEQTVRFTRTNLPAARCLTVDGRVFHNSGASGSDEVALALSCGAEYVRELLKRDINVHDIAASLRFSFAAGPNFFAEIAKFRAARMLWAKIMYHFSAEQKPSISEDGWLKMEMHITASQWHQTAIDPYVNMLRGTIEAMSAAIGGGRSITTLPFDSACGAKETFAGRIAGNTQVILQDEAYLTEVVDPSAGSYYVETLTENIARQAWSRFRETEKNGGYIASLERGTVQQLLEKSADNKQQRVMNLSDVLVGTNKYQNSGELPHKTTDKGEGSTADVFKQSVTENTGNHTEVAGKGDRENVRQALDGITRDNFDALLSNVARATAAGATTGEVLSRLSSVLEKADLEVRPIHGLRLSEEFERSRATNGRDGEKKNV